MALAVSNAARLLHRVAKSANIRYLDFDRVSRVDLGGGTGSASKQQITGLKRYVLANIRNSMRHVEYHLR